MFVDMETSVIFYPLFITVIVKMPKFIKHSIPFQIRLYIQIYYFPIGIDNKKESKNIKWYMNFHLILIIKNQKCKYGKNKTKKTPNRNQRKVKKK